jgi:hypothetical protein
VKRLARDNHFSLYRCSIGDKKKKRLITLTPGHRQGCHQLQEDRGRTHQVNCPNVRQRKGRHYRSNEYIDNKFLITPKPTLLPIIVLIRQKERSTKNR